jgi:hypothetical protein
LWTHEPPARIRRAETTSERDAPHRKETGSAAALEHLGNFGANFAERFLACLDPTGFYVYGDPSADVRSVLDGFGAAYLGSFGGFSRG